MREAKRFLCESEDTTPPGPWNEETDTRGDAVKVHRAHEGLPAGSVATSLLFESYMVRNTTIHHTCICCSPSLSPAFAPDHETKASSRAEPRVSGPPAGAGGYGPEVVCIENRTNLSKNSTPDKQVSGFGNHLKGNPHTQESRKPAARCIRIRWLVSRW
jgi:hypothetical protein